MGRYRSAETLTREDLREFQLWLLREGNARSGKGHSLTTAKRHFKYVRAAYQFAVREEVLDRDPTDGLGSRWPKPEQKAVHFLLAHDLRKIVAACESERDRAIIYTFLFTGLRPSELTSLAWEESERTPNWIDFTNEQIVIGRGKQGKPRIIPMHPVLKERLRSWWGSGYNPGGDGPKPSSERTGSTYVFETPFGRPDRRTVTRVCERLRRDSGVKFTPYTFRKSLQTDLTRAGVIGEIRDAIFGWAPVDIKGRHYTGLVAQDVRARIVKAYCTDPVVPEQKALKLEVMPGGSEVAELKAQVASLTAALVAAQAPSLEEAS